MSTATTTPAAVPAVPTPARWRSFWPGVVLATLVTALATGWGSGATRSSPTTRPRCGRWPSSRFTGTGPTPTVDQLRDDVAAGRVHLALSFPSADPRVVWVDQQCRAVPSKDPTFRVHVC